MSIKSFPSNSVACKCAAEPADCPKAGMCLQNLRTGFEHSYLMQNCSNNITFLKVAGLRSRRIGINNVYALATQSIRERKWRGKEIMSPNIFCSKWKNLKGGGGKWCHLSEEK